MVPDDQGINNETPQDVEAENVEETPADTQPQEEAGGETIEAGSPEDETNKQLDAQTALLGKQKLNVEAQTNLIEAQQKLTTAGLPTPSVTAPGSDTTVSSGDESYAGYFANFAAYQAMQRCAKAVSKRINDSKPGSEAKIMLVDSLDFVGDDYTLALVKRRFEFFDKALQSQIDLNTSTIQAAAIRVEEPAPSGAVAMATLGTVLSVAPQIIGSIAQAVSYFKVDYTVTKQKIDIKLSTLQAEVAGQLSNHSQIFHFNLIDTEKGLLRAYADLVNKRFELKATLERLKAEVVERKQVELQALAEQLTTAQTALEAGKGTEAEAQLQAKYNEIKQQHSNLTRQKTEADSAVEVTGRLLESFDGFVTSITSTQEGQTQPQLVTAALRDYLRDTKITHLLYLDIPSHGGEMITKKGLFDLGGGVTYLGGSTVTFVLAETSGKIVTGGMAVEATEVFSKLGSSQVTVKLIDLKTD